MNVPTFLKRRIGFFTGVFCLVILASALFTMRLRFGNAAFSGKSDKASSEDVFSVGETINFGVYSNIINVGSGKLVYLGSAGKEPRQMQRVRLEVNALSVKDKEDIYGSRDFSYPVKVERDIVLFGRHEKILEKYSQENKKLDITKTSAEGVKSWSITSKEPFENVVLMIYNLRNSKDFRIGKEYKINLPTQKFSLIVRKKTTLKVPLGKFEVFYIESKPAKYKIWVSADQKRLPLRIQGLISFGMLYLAATSVETK